MTRTNTCPHCGHYLWAHGEDGRCIVRLWDPVKAAVVSCPCLDHRLPLPSAPPIPLEVR